MVNLIEIRHQQRFIRELNQVYIALNAKAPLEPVTEQFPEGSTVTIIHGPFAGIEGVVVKSASSLQLMLSVECLGRAVLKIERAWIRGAEE